jgi:hypothetical protein
MLFNKNWVLQSLIDIALQQTLQQILSCGIHVGGKLQFVRHNFSEKDRSIMTRRGGKTLRKLLEEDSKE